MRTLSLVLFVIVIVGYSFVCGAGVLGSGAFELYYWVVLPVAATAWAHGRSRPAGPVPIQRCGIVTLAWFPISILYYLTYERGVGPLLAAVWLLAAYALPIIAFALGFVSGYEPLSP